MSECEKFLHALKENEDDVPVRLAFADWLDEQGEHEEADRQRKWTASKAWIIGFCEDHNPEEFDDFSPLTYPGIMEMALDATKDADKDTEGDFFCGRNEGLRMSDQWNEFWKHWSIVTGIPMAPEVVQNIRYSCAC
jgi:uncharacterized protein (TIGR02996 family)